MNWWLTVPLVVALVQSGLSCIILLQNLTEQEGYENIDDDYNLEVPETSAQVNVEENGVLDQVRDKRKTEENKKGSALRTRKQIFKTSKQTQFTKELTLTNENDSHSQQI
ncbi:uncharacterized protein LOC103516897 [Diaphorina citri]|uniref:Uncharacterized protein LOC103516897 n=1 Tax=Diaphorina citri TaxID=121845 RepID=A0A1S3DEN1_DIACI|nr:uncharacterized protein LOC103516897 [Diaphorina citri]